MTGRFLLSLTVSSALCITVKAADEPSAVGFWVTQNNDAVVQIVPCDSGLCGYLVGLRPGQAPADYPKDTHNPDTARHGDSLCGLMLMGSLKPVAGNPPKWTEGWVYDPLSGSTYSAGMTLEAPTRLRLRGYLGISLFGRTEIWTREGDTKNRCVVPPDAG